MNLSRTRTGSTLIEMALFLGIVAIMSTAIVGAYISIQDARLRQQYMSEVGQRGIQLLGTIIKDVRSSEKILSPQAGIPGSTLAMQMTENNVNPTVFMPITGGNVLLIQKTATASLLGARVTATGLQFTNVAGNAVTVSFDMNVLVPTMPPSRYTEHFTGTATLAPKKMSNGGCAQCAPPTCSAGQYQWQYCDNGVCTASPVHVGC